VIGSTTDGKVQCSLKNRPRRERLALFPNFAESSQSMDPDIGSSKILLDDVKPGWLAGSFVQYDGIYV